MICPYCDEVTPNDDEYKKQYIKCQECKISVRQW